MALKCLHGFAISEVHVVYFHGLVLLFLPVCAHYRPVVP